MHLSVKNISKKLKNNLVIDNVSLELESGNIYGFVGKNGSGKTMLFRALSGLMPCDSGTIIYNNKTLHKDFAVLPHLGIVIENAGLYPELTGLNNLLNLAQLNGIVNKEKIINTIERVGLNPMDKSPFRKYSLGMKQRIILAQAIMEEPEILMLDEPTNALDEDGVELIRKIIIEERDRGALILIASHNKEDIELLADYVYKVEKGKINLEGGKHYED